VAEGCVARIKINFGKKKLPPGRQGGSAIYYQFASGRKGYNPFLKKRDST